MGYIHIHHLNFHYEGHPETIFEDVSLNLDTKWNLGLVGRNGRGKTTLLKLILEELDSNGAIKTDTHMRYFPYHVKDETKQVFEILEEIVGEVDWRIYKELNLLKIDASVLYQPYQTLSPGERSKVLLACLFIDENDFVLIDEPTNHLDEKARELVSSYLKNKQGFILVSHDRHFLDGCIDHVLSINKKSIVLHQGNFSTYLNNKYHQDQLEIHQNERLKKEIKRLKVASEKTGQWSDAVEKSKIGAADKGYVGHMAAKMMKRSKNIEKRYEGYIEEKKGLMKDVEEVEDLNLHPLPINSKRVMYLDHLDFSYGENEVLKDFCLAIENGDKICLRGKNGCGKSTVLKLVCGHLQPQRGKILARNDLKIAYAFQDTGMLEGKFESYLEKEQVDGVLCRAILRKLGFERHLFEKNLKDLSQGQKKKVVLAVALSKSCHLYVFDEPMNYIDLDSRMQIETLLSKTDMTCIFVEHDRVFCDKIASKVCEIKKYS